MPKQPSRRLTWAERKARARCRCVVLVSGAVLTRYVARLKASDPRAAKALHRLSFTGTPGRVVGEGKGAVVLIFNGARRPYAVPANAVKTVKSANQRRS